MARQCELTGKQVCFGNNVSHSNRKSRRTFKPNLRSVKLESAGLKRSFSLQVAVSTLRTIEFKGGLDAYLLNTKSAKLTALGQKLRRKLKKCTPAPDKKAAS